MNPDERDENVEYCDDCGHRLTHHRGCRLVPPPVPAEGPIEHGCAGGGA